MQMEKIKFGIVGYGSSGPRHRERIIENKYAELVAVCDVDEKKISCLKNSQISLFTDYKDMLEMEKIDVVSVCTPNYLHKEMTIEALKTGKHVLCEKPMALTSKDCKIMVHTSLVHNRKLFIVKQNRYNPPVSEIKKLIEEKKLGNLYSIIINCYWNRDENYYKNSLWRGIKKYDGGALFTQFSHFIDLMLWFCGSVESVSAFAGNFNHTDIEIDDTGVVNLKFDSGTLGAINYSNCSYKKNMEGSITVFAEKGTIKIGGQYINELEYQSIENYEIKDLELSKGPNEYGAYQGSMSNHDKVYENVVQSLLNGKDVGVSGIEGMWTIEVIEAIYKSSESGRIVYL